MKEGEQKGLTVRPTSISIGQLDVMNLVHRVRLDGEEVPQNFSNVLDDIGITLPHFFPESRGGELATDNDGRSSVPRYSNREESRGRVVEWHGSVDSSLGIKAVQSSPHLEFAS